MKPRTGAFLPVSHGHFSADSREFCITNPFTPRPWHNYLWISVYLANITQHATGGSFYQPPDEGLRTNITEDRDGNGGRRFVYLRDNDSGEYWSATGAPSPHPLDAWECRVGLGYQITFGHRLLDPQVARACILEVFAKQFPSGKCIRAWRLPNGVLDLQHDADSPSWMIMALSFYLKETGDFALLDERVPFLNPEDPYQPPTSNATVREHVVLAQRHLLQHRGAHGLTKIYYGDWCDTMNGVGRAGRGERVMLSMQVKRGCDLLADLADRTDDPALAREMRTASAELDAAINRVAWDGQWYLRAFDDEGIPVGSNTPPASDNGEGRIFLNTQTWSVLSGGAPEDRKNPALDSALRHLDTGYGMVLNWPALTGLKPRIGQVTAMTPASTKTEASMSTATVSGSRHWPLQAAVPPPGTLSARSCPTRQASQTPTPSRPLSPTITSGPTSPAESNAISTSPAGAPAPLHGSTKSASNGSLVPAPNTTDSASTPTFPARETHQVRVILKSEPA